MQMSHMRMSTIRQWTLSEIRQTMGTWKRSRRRVEAQGIHMPSGKSFEGELMGACLNA